MDIQTYLLDLQQRICTLLEKEEERLCVFKEENWQHKEGGGGKTCILSNGNLLEKCGVNYSHVYGRQLPPTAAVKRPELANASFQAQGVSVVVHPLNPYIPTSHFNVRYIVVEKAGHPIHWWFGGGFDLTPYYVFMEDCEHWHNEAKLACAPFGNQVYEKYKKWCDDYFYLKHREEPRGIGGLFFDDLYEWGFDQCFQFIQSVAEHYIKAYQPIISRRKDHPFGEQERLFQTYRRGRYVEFNLLYDRGTLFGLQSGGRTESILMSLPPMVTWQYEKNNYILQCEAILKNHFLLTREW